MVLVALVAAGGFGLASEGNGRWDLSGTVVGSTPYGRWIASFVPEDNELNHYYYIADGIWAPPFGATRATDFSGQCDRTGPTSFKCTTMAYGANDAYQIVAIYVAYETLERLPDRTVMRKMDVCVYGPDQDPLGEEYPAFGCYSGSPEISNWKMLVVRDAPE
jgi:hypothetical protein